METQHGLTSLSVGEPPFLPSHGCDCVSACRPSPTARRPRAMLASAAVLDRALTLSRRVAGPAFGRKVTHGALARGARTALPGSVTCCGRSAASFENGAIPRLCGAGGGRTGHVRAHRRSARRKGSEVLQEHRSAFHVGSADYRTRCSPLTHLTVPLEARMTTLSVVILPSRRYFTPSRSEPEVTPVAAKMQSPRARSSSL